MGRLYTGSGTFTLDPEKTLATFDEKCVYGPHNDTLMYYEMFYDIGRIYRTQSLDGMIDKLAECDAFGRLSRADGMRLGECKDGEVRDAQGHLLAYYEGNICGAAAAAYAIFFASVSSDKKKEALSDDDSSASGGGNTSGGGASSDTSGVEVILAMLGVIAAAVWRFIKTIPLWGPYAAILLIPFLSRVSFTTESASGAGPSFLVFFAGLSVFVYYVLHTVLLLKCKKRAGKHRYMPVYVGFFLFAVPLVIAFGFPAVTFQIAWLLEEKKASKCVAADVPTEIPCPRCGETIISTTKYCLYCGAAVTHTPVREKPLDLRKKVPGYITLPVIVLVVLAVVQCGRFVGWRGQVREYFAAMEWNETEEIMALYNWKTVEEANARRANQRWPLMEFPPYESLEEYVETNDKYYRFCAGRAIEDYRIVSASRKFTDISRTKIVVEAYVDFADGHQDVVVRITMEGGPFGWYMTEVDAGYPTDEYVQYAD